MGAEPITPAYRSKLIQDLKDQRQEYGEQIHLETDRAKGAEKVEQQIRDILTGVNTERKLGERQEALRQCREISLNAGVRAKELVIEIQETRAELSRVELSLENVAVLGKIERAVEQGKTQNWIMVGLTIVITVMTGVILCATIQQKYAQPPSTQEQQASSMYQE